MAPQQQATRLLEGGHTKEAVAMMLGVPVSTIERWAAVKQRPLRKPSEERNRKPEREQDRLAAIDDLFREGHTREKIEMVFGKIIPALLLCLAFAAGAFAQTHVPTLTVDGDTVTVDADICWVDPDLEGVTLKWGTTLGGVRVFASSDGESPIEIRMPPGTHSITALGFPDDRLNPRRNEATLTAVVTPPSRQTLITRAYEQIIGVRGQWQKANAELAALQPTFTETRNALVEIASGQ